MKPADEVLMARVREGDRAAFEHLIDRHERRVFTFFYRRVHDNGHAEDMTLDVWMKIYQARQNYRPDAKFTTYLYRVARNHWIDYMRVHHSGSRPSMVSIEDAGSDQDGPSLLDALGAPGESPERRQYSAELAAKIREGVDQLSTGEAEVFRLAIFDEIRYAEIGRILDIPVGTVKSRMHTSMHKLRRWLSREGITP